MTISQTLANTRPSEAGHWYDFRGAPMYEVMSAKNEPRPTTLRDARKLGLVPSVSAIIRCADKPALGHWMQEQVLLAALTTERRPMETEQEYVYRIMKDSREQAATARDKGTEIHAAIQGAYEGKECAPEHLETVEATLCSIDGVFGHGRLWIAEASFCHPRGFGGKCDLHTKSDLGPVVIDFKTKDFTDAGKKMAYEEHAMQLAAYAHGFGIPHARCANAFVSTTSPGLVVIHEWSAEEIRKGWAMFCGLLDYWQAKNQYFPVIQEAQAA